MRVFHQAACFALSFLHNSREDGGKKGSSHFDKQVKPGFTNYQPRGLLFSQSNQIRNMTKSKTQNFLTKIMEKFNGKLMEN